MSMLSQMKADTVTILADWADSIKVTRNTIDLTHAISADSWATVDTYTGDWQPYSGSRNPSKDIISEPGISDDYNAQVYLPFDADVEIGDRIYKNATYFEYVSVVRNYEDHIEVFTKINRNS